MRDSPIVNRSVVANISPVAGSSHINRRPSSSTSKRTGELNAIARIRPHCRDASTIRALPHSDHSFFARMSPCAASVAKITMIAAATRSSGRLNPLCPFWHFLRRFTQYITTARVLGRNFFELPDQKNARLYLIEKFYIINS